MSKESKAEYQRRYRQTPDGKAITAKHNCSESSRASKQKYKASEKGRSGRKQWNQTETGRLAGRRYRDRQAGRDHQQSEILRESVLACQICGSIQNLHVDHDHKTGQLRGRLCNNCNHGLGSFHDSPFFMSRAIDYIKHYSPNNF